MSNEITYWNEFYNSYKNLNGDERDVSIRNIICNDILNNKTIYQSIRSDGDKVTKFIGRMIEEIVNENVQSPEFLHKFVDAENRPFSNTWCNLERFLLSIMSFNTFNDCVVESYNEMVA